MEKKFYKILEGISVVLLYLMVILVFVNVACRYFFKISVVSTEELAKFLFIWVSFVGSSVALKTGEHLSIDVIREKVSPKVMEYVNLFSDFIVLFVCIAMAIGGITVVQSGMEVFSPSLDIPYAYVEGIVPVMFSLMGIIQMQKIYVKVKK